ncbi:protein DEK-like isoform X2 [Homarus americanus]|uniref:protein DEK-like isoform X2 n=1 Tax=Homarus americanus TaxID=6706 RepID=UPI001C48426A|nr:protein DEK-like isoform X2 [Homarus americanus]
MSDDETKQPVNETTDEEKKEEEEVKDEEKMDTKEEAVEEHKSKEDVETKKEEVEEKQEEEKEEEKEMPAKTEKVKPVKETIEKEAVNITPTKESEVPLYDQPLEMSGKRDRKKVERFVQETKKEDVESTGTGTALGDIPFIEAMIMKMSTDELKVLHRVAYSRPGSGSEIKKNLRKFNGFPFNKEDKKYQSKLSTVERILMSELKKMLMILGLERSGNKGEVVERLMAFMLEPQDTGKRPPKTVKKGKGKGRPRKGQEKKRENNTSMNDSGTGGSDSNESESEEQDSEEEGEKPRKTLGRKPQSKKTPAKRAASTKKATPSRRSKVADSDDSDSDDEPLAKKAKQPPSDAELKAMVKKILEGANLEEVTMKSVCRQVYDNYPEFDLTHKKVFIKETVKSIIS